MHVKHGPGVVEEFFLFVKRKKNWIIFPALAVMVLMLIIMIFIETPALLPFFYAVF
jgi:hypothetical protein